MKFDEFSNVLTKWINSLELIQNKCNNVINVAEKQEFMDTLLTKLFNRENLTYTTALQILNENYPKFKFNGSGSGSGSEFQNFVPFLGLLMFDKVVKGNEKLYQTMLLKYVDEHDHHVFQQFFEYLLDFDDTIISYDIVKKAILSINSKIQEFNSLDCSVYESNQQSFTNNSTKLSTPLKTFFDTPKTDRSIRQNEVIQTLRNLLEVEQKEKQELIEDFNETKRELETCQQHLKTKSGQYDVLKDEHKEVITENDNLRQIEIRSRELQTRISNLEKQVFGLQNKNDQLGSENNTLLDRISDLEVINEDQEINILVQKQILEDEHIKYDKLVLDLQQVNDEKNLLNSAKEELETMVKELTAKHQPIDFNDSSWSIDESFSICKRADVSTQSEKSLKNLKEELLETENEKLKSELRKFEEEYNIKVHELNDNQIEITQLNMQIQDLNSEITSLNDRKGFLQDELQETIKHLQRELNTTKLNYQQISEEYEMVSKLNSEFIGEIKKKDNLTDSLTRELKLFKNEFDKLDNELQSKVNMFNERETKYVDEIQKLEQLKKSQLSNIQELTDKLQNVNDEKHEAKTNYVKSLEQYRDEFNELNLKHKSLSSQVESLRKDKHDLGQIISQLKEKANQFETENVELRNQIDRMKLNLEDEGKLKSDNEKLASELDTVKNRLLILENTIDSHCNVFDSDVKDNLESKINHLVNIIEQNTALLAVKDMKINELTTINDSVNLSLQNLQIIKSGLEDDLNLNSEKLEACSMIIANFEIEINENSRTLKMFELKNAALEKQISTTENSLRNLENEKKTMSNINKILETKLKDLENLQNFESDKFETTLHEKEREIEILKNSYSNSNLIIDDLKENLSQKNQDCNQLKIQFENITEALEQFARFLKATLSDSDCNAASVQFEDEKFAILVPVVLDYKTIVDEKLLESEITKNSLIKLFDKLNEEKALLMNDKVLLQKENAQLLQKLNSSKDKQNHELESLKMQLRDYNDVKTEIAQLEKLKNIFIEEKSKLIEKLLNEKATIDKQILKQSQNVKQLSDKLNSLQFLKSKVSKKFEEIELKKTLVDVALGAARKLLNASIRQILSDVAQCDKKYDSNFNKVLNTNNFDERFLMDFNVEYFNDVNEKIVEVNQFINDYAKMLQILEENCEKSDMERLKQIAVDEEYKQKYYTVKQKVYSVERSSHKLEEQLQIVLEKNRILKEQLKLYEDKQMNSESCEVKIVKEVKHSFENELSNVKLEWNKKLEIERSKLIKQHEDDILKLKTDFEEKLKRNINFYKEKYEKVCKMYQNHDELYLKEVSEEQHKGVLRENRLKAELDERNATINSLREQLKDISMKYVSLKNESKNRNGFASAENKFLAKCEDFGEDCDQSFFETNNKNILDFAIDNENIVPEVKRLSSKPEISGPSSVFGSRHTLNEVSRNTTSSVGRLSELQYRNSLCLPHLKSTYPAETQFLKPTDFDENEVRVGSQFFINDSNATLLPTEKSKKKDFGRKVRRSSPMKKRSEDQTLRESNHMNCIPTLKKMSTPMRVRQLFTRKTPIKDKDKDQQENIETHKSTPKSRKLSLFRSK